MVAIEESKDLEVMTVEELQNSLEAHEQGMMERKNTEKIVEQTFHVKTNQNKNKCHGGMSKRSRGGRGGGTNRD